MTAFRNRSGRHGQNHQTVGGEAAAEFDDTIDLPEGGHIGAAAIQHDKTIAGSGEMIQCHSLARMMSARSRMPGSIFASSMNEKLSRIVLRCEPSV